MGEPFADFVGVTVPREFGAELLSEVVPELEALGMVLESESASVRLWRAPEAHGTVQARYVQGVMALGVSGSVCAGLRAAGRFASFLASVGALPHRVTRLDAALDVVEDAAPVVARVTARGRAGELSLTRKAISRKSVHTHLSLRDDGVETGTVYCGGKAAEARMVVYDKRAERLSKRLPDIGPLTRYELRLRSGVGMTLRDCAAPASVFWHHVAPDFLPRPDGVPEWVACASGFDLERLPPLSPAQRLSGLVDRSRDLERMKALVAECGPYGFDLFASLVRKRFGV